MVTDVGKVDPKTGQVTGESKSARVSDLELYAMMIHDTPNILKEYYTFRSGDPVSKADALHEIATKGSVALADLHINPMNRVALNSANVALIGACLETNLVTENGILPRTFQMKESRGLSRSKTKL